MNGNGSHALPTSDFFSSLFLVGNVGGPFLLGMAVGYFAKKMLKLALFVGGAIVVALFISEYYGVITINEAALENVAGAAAETAKQSGGFLIDRLSHFASRGVSGSAGFLWDLNWVEINLIAPNLIDR